MDLHWIIVENIKLSFLRWSVSDSNQNYLNLHHDSLKAGISKEQSKIAVDYVVDYLKDKLPDPIAGQVDSVLSGKGGADDLMKGLGGILGK